MSKKRLPERPPLFTVWQSMGRENQLREIRSETGFNLFLNFVVWGILGYAAYGISPVVAIAPMGFSLLGLLVIYFDYTEKMSKVNPEHWEDDPADTWEECASQE